MTTMTTLHGYTVSLDTLNLKRLLPEWYWLTGGDKEIIAITKLGEAILQDLTGNLFFLSTTRGTLDDIPGSKESLFEADIYEAGLEELFLPKLIDRIENSGKSLSDKEVYSYYVLPVMGGKCEADNMFNLSIYDHFAVNGKIHFQIKSLSVGVKANLELNN